MSTTCCTQRRLEPTWGGSFETVRSAVVLHGAPLHGKAGLMWYKHNRNGREVKIYDLKILLQICSWETKSVIETKGGEDN